MSPVILAEVSQVFDEVVGEAQGVRAVVAQHPAAADQDVLVGPLIVTQRAPVGGEVASRGEGAGVLVVIVALLRGRCSAAVISSDR